MYKMLFDTCPNWHVSYCTNVSGVSIVTLVTPLKYSSHMRPYWYVSNCTICHMTRFQIFTCRLVNIGLWHWSHCKCHTAQNVKWHLSPCNKFPVTRFKLWKTSGLTCYTVEKLNFSPVILNRILCDTFHNVENFFCQVSIFSWAILYQIPCNFCAAVDVWYCTQLFRTRAPIATRDVVHYFFRVAFRGSYIILKGNSLDPCAYWDMWLCKSFIMTRVRKLSCHAILFSCLSCHSVAVQYLKGFLMCTGADMFLFWPRYKVQRFTGSTVHRNWAHVLKHFTKILKS